MLLHGISDQNLEVLRAMAAEVAKAQIEEYDLTIIQPREKATNRRNIERARAIIKVVGIVKRDLRAAQTQLTPIFLWYTQMRLLLKIAVWMIVTVVPAIFLFTLGLFADLLRWGWVHNWKY